MATRVIWQTGLWLVALAIILFLSAGDWRWPQGWVFMAENAVGSFVVSLWLLRRDPALLEERLSSPLRRDQRPADRLLVALIFPAYVGWMVLMALDGRRFRWTATPVWAQGLGALAVVLCFVMVWWTFRYNSFAVPQVRVQAERAQTVVSDGPYRFVRHPMYSGAALLFFGAPLLLSSLWGLAGGLALTAAMGLRALGEERVLSQDLAGYDAYARQVRFRLVPGLW
jgi:protein-S-isoprenylcysteine O-methyltransferase Ste14